MLNFDLSYLAHPGSPLARLSDEETDSSSLAADDIRNTSGGSSGLHSGGEEAQSPPLPASKGGLSKRREENRPSRVHTSTPQLGDDDDLDGSIPPELEKPALSYVALISKAILSSPQRRLLLGDIYKYITTTYPYYRFLHDKAWKNSIRHNLSLNECFVKSGRSADGKGNYWAIHPACAEDFKNGDFRRRQARRRAKRCQQQQQQQQQQPQSCQLEASAMNPALSAACHYGYVPMTQTPSAAAMATTSMLPGASTTVPSYSSYPYYQPYTTRSRYLPSAMHSVNQTLPNCDTVSTIQYPSTYSYPHQTTSMPTYIQPVSSTTRTVAPNAQTTSMPTYIQPMASNPRTVAPNAQTTSMPTYIQPMASNPRTVAPNAQTTSMPTYIQPVASNTRTVAPNVTATQITVAQYHNQSAQGNTVTGLPLSTLREAVTSLTNQYSYM